MLKEWHPDNPPPETISRGSGKICKFVCFNCGQMYKTSPMLRITHERSDTMNGCPQCGRAKRGRNRLALLMDVLPTLAEEYDRQANSRPLESLTCGSGYKAQWRCATCGNKWTTQVFLRANLGYGCPQPSCIKQTRLRRLRMSPKQALAQHQCQNAVVSRVLLKFY